MSKAAESTYEGRPVITLKRDDADAYPFSFGVGKARMILENVEAIRAFYEAHKHEKRPRPQGQGSGDGRAGVGNRGASYERGHGGGYQGRQASDGRPATSERPAAGERGGYDAGA